MKKIKIITALFCFSISINAQNNESIFIGKIETIYSKVLDENRKLWIYNPHVTSKDVNIDKRYPVLYLLDGDAHFFSTVGIVQQLSQANGNGVLPEMIVVAIENTNRLKDLSPKLLSTNNLDNANPFINFLSSELIPFVDKNYQTTPYRLLVGHSLGGLTAIDILTNFPELFDAYIAIDPSMWYDNEKYLNQYIIQLAKQNFNKTRLFIGTANTMPAGMTFSKLKNDNTVETQHIRSIFKFDKFLKSNSNGLQYAQKYYEKERHNTVPLLSEYDGLRFIFDYYFLDASEKDFSDSTALIASKLKTHYTKVSSEMGYKVSAPESLINYFGYDALTRKQYDKAEALFKLNMESYPNSNNVYDSYADYFAAKKDTINALVYYKKAFQIKNDATTLSKINTFTKQESFNLTVKDLQKYAGIYWLEAYKIDIILEIRDSRLWSKIPGQASSEWMPLAKDVFTVKGKQGYTITFQMSGDKPVSFTSVQPDGTFICVLKNE